MIGRRTALVAALVGAASTIVLAAWYQSGTRAAAREGAEQVAAVERGAIAHAEELADELTTELEELRAREATRPYLHYQNLFHDPDGASAGPSVTPSPLATGAADPLIAIHFEIDAAGRVGSPSINDELPEARQAAAPDRGALTAIAAAHAELVAVAARAAVRVEPTPATLVAAAPRRSSKQKQVAAPLTPQVIKLEPEAYALNQSTNAIYAEQRGLELGGKTPSQVAGDGAQRADSGAQRADSAVPPGDRAAPSPTPRPARPTRPRPVAAPVIVTVAPLLWTVESIAGESTLVAIRQVVTPDGARTQGFTIDRAQLVDWLAERDATARLVSDGGAALGIADAPWRIVADDPDGLAYARTIGADLRANFQAQFAAIAALVALCGLVVIVVAARGERLAEQRVQFAAAAAHELRTPLAGIQLYGDMLADDLGDPARHRDYARRVAVEAARLGRVVGNVMGVSQLERGTLAVRTETIDLMPVVREAVERAEPALARAGASIELRAPAVALARGDRDAVARVLGNLLDNAEKYGRDADDRTITITVVVDDAGVSIAVRDRGPGLPPALRRGRFRPFTRAAGADGPAGLGLGLALSAALARAMGGALTPRPVSPGAELVLRLPIRG